VVVVVWGLGLGFGFGLGFGLGFGVVLVAVVAGVIFVEEDLLPQPAMTRAATTATGRTFFITRLLALRTGSGRG
jgi:hypothetical protein